MKKFYTLLAAAATTVAAMAWEAPSPLPTTMYLIGDPCSSAKAEVPDNAVLGSPSESWSPLNGIPMEKTADGVFEVSIKLTAQCWFAFNPELQTSDPNWDTWNPNRYCPAAGGNAEVGANPMKIGDKPAPDSWQIPAGDYKFTVDANTGIMTVAGNLVREMGKLYLRGGMNGWLNEADDAEKAKWELTSTDDNIYTISHIDLAASDAADQAGEWKIANMDWSFKFIAANPLPEDDPDALRASLILLPDVDYYLEPSEDYNNGMKEAIEDATITLNIEEETIRITKSAGISAVEVAEDAPAVYYNLQGVRVANPEKGLFIQVKGGKAAKVVL